MTAATGAAAPAMVVERLKRRALSLGVAKAFDYGMQFLLPVVLVRILDATTFGEYRLLWLAVMTVMVTNLNLPGSLYFFLPRADPAGKRLYIAQTLLFLAGTGVLSAWAVSPWNPWLPEAIAPLSRYGALVPVFTALWLTATLLDSLPTVDERVKWQAAVTMGLSLLRVVMLALGAFYSADLGVLLWLLVAFVVLKLALLVAYIARFHGLRPPWFSRRLFAGQFRHAAPIGVSIACFGLRSQADQWVVAHLYSLSNFAAFSVAAVLSPLVNVFRGAVTEAFLPSLSRMHSAGTVRDMLEVNSRCNVMVASLVYPALAFAFAFAPEIVTLIYTSTYIDAAPVMRVYIAGFAVMVIETYSMVLVLREGQFALWINLFMLPAAVGLSWFGGTHWGLAGAAAGSVAALYLDRTLLLRRFAARSGVTVAQLQDWRGLATTLACASLAALLAWGAVHGYLPAASVIVRLALGGSILAMAYAALWSIAGMRKAIQPS